MTIIFKEKFSMNVIQFETFLDFFQIDEVNVRNYFEVILEEQLSKIDFHQLILLNISSKIN
jgi:hypothetical protein